MRSGNSIYAGQDARGSLGVGSIFRENCRQDDFFVPHPPQLKADLHGQDQRRPGREELHHDTDCRDLLCEVERVGTRRYAPAVTSWRASAMMLKDSRSCASTTTANALPARVSTVETTSALRDNSRRGKSTTTVNRSVPISADIRGSIPRAFCAGRIRTTTVAAITTRYAITDTRIATFKMKTAPGSVGSACRIYCWSPTTVTSPRKVDHISIGSRINTS